MCAFITFTIHVADVVHESLNGRAQCALLCCWTPSAAGSLVFPNFLLASDRDTQACLYFALLSICTQRRPSYHRFVLAAGEEVCGDSSLAARAENQAGVKSMQLMEEGSNASHMAGHGKQVQVLTAWWLATAFSQYTASALCPAIVVFVCNSCVFVCFVVEF